MENPPQPDPTTATRDATGVVVIGDAEYGEPYVRALTKLSQARVIGLLVPSGQNGAAADSTIARSTDDPSVAAEWDGVDAFVHCGPLDGSPESIAMVTAASKPVFLDSQGGRQRADARTVRACVEAGEIGQVVFARFAVGGRPDDVSTTAQAGRDRLAWQQRTHVLDMLGWWIGDDPDTVYAQRSHDYESVTVHYADGATAVCDISSAAPSYREVAVVGTSASMSLTWADHANVLLPAKGSGAQYLDGSPSLDTVLDEWLVRVRAGTAPNLDTSGLVAATALDEAIELSIRSGRVANVTTSWDDGSHS